MTKFVDWIYNKIEEFLNADQPVPGWLFQWSLAGFAIFAIIMAKRDAQMVGGIVLAVGWSIIKTIRLIEQERRS